LQRAVNDSLKALTKWQQNGFNNFDLMQVAFRADRIVTTQEHEALALRVKDLRKLDDAVAAKDIGHKVFPKG
jgi:hypothetical protein